jgi:hypothetical protein
MAASGVRAATGNLKLLDAVALPPEPEGLGGGVVTLTARVTVAPACGVRVAAWRVVMVLLLVLVTTPLLAAGSRLGEGLVVGDREALLVVPVEGLEVAVNDRVLVLLGVLPVHQGPGAVGGTTVCHYSREHLNEKVQREQSSESASRVASALGAPAPTVLHHSPAPSPTTQ